MAITKARREELVAQYRELIDQSEAIFLAEYKGMSVKRLESLRREVRGANGVFHVTKNTLLEFALRQANKPDSSDLLKGQLATGFAREAAPAMAKKLVDFAKSEEHFTLKGAIMGDLLLTVEQVEALASLPSLDELRAQLMGVISAPARNLVSTLANGIRQVVNVIDAYANSEEAAESA